MSNKLFNIFEKSEATERSPFSNVERQLIRSDDEDILEEPCSLTEFLGISPQGNINRQSIADTYDTDADDLCDLRCFIGQTSQGNVTRKQVSLVSNFEPAPGNKLDKLFEDADKDPLNLPKGFGQQLQKDRIANELTAISEYLAATGRFCLLENGLCIYEESHWRRLNKHDSVQAIRQAIEGTPFEDLTLSVKNLNDLVVLLKTTPSIKMVRSDFLPHDYMINCRDGVYDILRKKIIPSNPDFGFFDCAPTSVYEIGKREGPYFEKYVGNAGNGMRMFRTLILEIFLVIFGHVNVKKFFLFLGPGDTGKTQLIVMLLKLIGDFFSMAVTDLNDFEERWTFGSLLNKRLCACLDLPNVPVNAGALSKIKQLVGDDPVLGEIKYENPFFFYPEATLLFASNHKLLIPDIESEKAFFNRLVVVPFSNPVSEKDQIDKFYLKLAEEFPYILGEAIKIAEDFHNRNENFCEVVSPYDGVVGCETSNNNVNLLIDFVAECCIADEDGEITTEELFNHFNNNYSKYDSENQLGYINFARKIKEPMVAIGAVPIKDVRGTGNRGFRGIRIKEDEENAK